MKNIFLVINREKLYAYIVSMLTICILFFMSGMINKDLDGAETTSSNLTENVIEENIVENKEVTNNSIIQNTVNENTNSTEQTSGETINIIL